MKKPVSAALAWKNNEGPWGNLGGNKPRKEPKTVGQGHVPEDGQPPRGWSQQGNQNQPDLEAVVNEMVEKLRGFWRQQQGGNGGGGWPNGGNGDGGLPIPVLPWQNWFYIALGLWAVSGFYIVAPEQQGVVTRFGAYLHTTNPGLHYHLPFPFEKVVKVPVTQVRQVTIGAGEQQEGFADEGLMLTGDGNMVDLTFTVQWRVIDPAAFLFNVVDVENTVAEVAESAVREVIGQYKLNDALTSGREQIAPLVQQHLQQILDFYKAGVQITAINLQQVNPPSAVVDAFRDVQAAEADQQRSINEANAYRNQILPLAQGQVARIAQEAEAYQTAVVADATGAAARFNAQVGAYQSAPVVTTQRLYLETMEQVMSQTPKVVLGGRGAQGVLPYLPLDKLPGGPRPVVEGGR
ncbi:MAG: FtsH protease activity modulator HflK [Proteobacteria bacterium]|nr:FtsH protease activity modulator HflK [Pseudomonadota bacterium]